MNKLQYVIIELLYDFNFVLRYKNAFIPHPNFIRNLIYYLFIDYKELYHINMNIYERLGITFFKNLYPRYRLGYNDTPSSYHYLKKDENFSLDYIRKLRNEGEYGYDYWKIIDFEVLSGLMSGIEDIYSKSDESVSFNFFVVVFKNGFHLKYRMTNSSFGWPLPVYLQLLGETYEFPIDNQSDKKIMEKVIGNGWPSFRTLFILSKAINEYNEKKKLRDENNIRELERIMGID